jgi:guanylate kinase
MTSNPKDKREKLIICGPSGSGKDHLQRQMIDLGLRFAPKVTTRPMRSGEQQGREYDFVTDEAFVAMLAADEVKTMQSFSVGDQVWHYAITWSNFRDNQLFIMTPTEIAMLTPEERKGCFVVYLCIDEQVRFSRVNRRNDQNDSIARRFMADKKDFDGFPDYDMKVTDPELDPQVVYDLMS